MWNNAGDEAAKEVFAEVLSFFGERPDAHIFGAAMLLTLDGWKVCVSRGEDGKIIAVAFISLNVFYYCSNGCENEIKVLKELVEKTRELEEWSKLKMVSTNLQVLADTEERAAVRLQSFMMTGATFDQLFEPPVTGGTLFHWLATDSDQEQVARLYFEFYQHPMVSVMARSADMDSMRETAKKMIPAERVMLFRQGEDDAFACGMVTWSPVYEFAGRRNVRISCCYLDDAVRGKGLAKATLLAACSHLFQELSVDVVFLFANKRYDVAMSFYSTFGFEKLEPESSLTCMDSFLEGLEAGTRT